LPEKAFISFRIKKQAMLFKIVWIPCDPPSPSVVLPIIRRVMPSIIAQDIIGVSPMTGPVSDIFTLRVKYADSQDQASTPVSPYEVRSGDEPGEEPDADRTSE
jgi:hypothetical protein